MKRFVNGSFGAMLGLVIGWHLAVCSGMLAESLPVTEEQLNVVVCGILGCSTLAGCLVGVFRFSR